MTELLNEAYLKLVSHAELPNYELRFTETAEPLKSSRQLIDACLN